MKTISDALYNDLLKSLPVLLEQVGGSNKSVKIANAVRLTARAIRKLKSIKDNGTKPKITDSLDRDDS